MENKLIHDKEQTYISNGFDIDKRIVNVGEFDELYIPPIIRAIDLMEEKSSEPITVIVNSYGGDTYQCFALYDRLRDCKSEIHTYGRGAVMSSGFVVFLAGDVRDCSTNCSFMCHSVSSGSYGKVRDQEVDLNESIRLNKIMLNIFTERTNKSKQYWGRAIKHEDRYYNKTQAKKLGVL